MSVPTVEEEEEEEEEERATVSIYLFLFYNQSINKDDTSYKGLV